MPTLKNELVDAARENLSRDQVLRILEERTQAAQHELASQTDAGADVLSYLAAHGGVATRRAVAANIAAPIHANKILCHDEDDDVRAELCRKIARLMPDMSCEEAEELRALTIEMLEKLAHDQVPRVRAILAEEIKHLTCVPKTVIDTLARDVEEIVARPILEYSPLLSDADLIEIIAGAKAEYALAAIAKRKSLSSEVSDLIVGTLDIPAIAALLVNPHAAIREQTLEKLVESAEAIDSWHEPLTLRTDLSARTLRRLASFVGTALLDILATRNGLDDDTRVYLNRRLRSRLQREEQSDAGNDAVREIVAAAQEGRLNDEYMEDLAEAGNKEAVIFALASLAQVPVPTVRRILDSRSGKAVVALVWLARLSMRVAVKIQNFVLKLIPGQSLAARGGKDFPLTEKEMLWQLNYFDVVPAGTRPASET
jgi:uncharacterized protein (DUF2336 family)